MTYTDFLASKRHNTTHSDIDACLPDWLYAFQRDLVTWALERGRSAIFADCGLGKTPMQLVWASNVYRHTGKPVLVLTPLGVSKQTEAEAHKFGIDAEVSRDGKPKAAVTITNYDRLHLFSRDDYGAVVCDESSAIKSFDGQRRAEVTEFIRLYEWRLLCTATAAPNDFIELGTSSEALGQMGHMDMLGRFFVNDQHSSHPMRQRAKFTVAADKWRFKGHAEQAFWQWVSTWARAMRKPSDLGYSDEGFILPPLTIASHEVRPNAPKTGMLFDLPAVNMIEQREEEGRTVKERCGAAAALLATAPIAVAWCQRNVEGDLLTKLIPGAAQLTGSDSPEKKEELIEAFGKGQIRVLVTKPSIAGWGLNWQHCSQMTYFPSHSYEQYYQSVRRFWRFGQKNPVQVDIVTTPGGANVLANLERKSRQADEMFAALVRYMNDAKPIEVRTAEEEVKVPSWL